MPSDCTVLLVVEDPIHEPPEDLVAEPGLASFLWEAEGSEVKHVPLPDESFVRVAVVSAHRRVIPYVASLFAADRGLRWEIVAGASS